VDGAGQIKTYQHVHWHIGKPELDSTAWGPQAGFGLLVVVPAVFVGLFFRRRIAGGLTAGAVKG
jgi:ABC-type glycerol-3-phosphate transport system permease component